jgi:hypothetical protein
MPLSLSTHEIRFDLIVTMTVIPGIFSTIVIYMILIELICCDDYYDVEMFCS